MYDDFQAVDRWSGTPLHCQYQAHPAWVEFNRQTEKVITDPMAVQIAGHYLKWAIESGEDSGREMYSLTVQETLNHLNAIIEENQVSAVAG